MPAIKYKKKTYAGATFPVLELTKAEYDALPDAKKMDGTVYMITDDDGGWEAERSTYDNTASGLTATNVQDALDELKERENFYAVSESSNISFGTTAISNPGNDGTKCIKYANGMKCMRGLFTVSSTIAASNDALFSVPSDYAHTTKDGTMQGWMVITKAFANDHTIMRMYGAQVYVWAGSLTEGIWMIDYLYA